MKLYKQITEANQTIVEELDRKIEKKGFNVGIQVMMGFVLVLLTVFEFAFFHIFKWDLIAVYIYLSFVLVYELMALVNLIYLLACERKFDEVLR